MTSNLQEEKSGLEKKLRASRVDLDDRDTSITLISEELNDARLSKDALEDELVEWRSKKSADVGKMRKTVSERDADVRKAAAEKKRLEAVVANLQASV
jgi:hypothetical protein